MARIRSIETWAPERAAAAADVYWLYCLTEQGSESSGPCKVGIASHLTKRVSSLQGGNWRPVVLCWVIRLHSRDDVKAVEQYCLMCLRPSSYSSDDRQLQSEWVAATPAKAFEVASRYVNAINDYPLKRVG